MTTISSDISSLLPKASAFGTPLTEEEKSTVEEILAQYDAESLTDEDEETLQQELRDAGVKPSRELGTLLEESGFDSALTKPGGLPPGGAGGPGGPGASGQSEQLISQEGLQTLTSILEEYDLESLSDEDVTSIQAKLGEAGFFGQGSVVDLGA